MLCRQFDGGPGRWQPLAVVTLIKIRSYSIVLRHHHRWRFQEQSHGNARIPCVWQCRCVIAGNDGKKGIHQVNELRLSSLTIFVLLLVIILSSGAASGYAYYQSQLPRVQGLANSQIEQSSRIYDRNGNLLYVAYDNKTGTGDVAHLLPTIHSRGNAGCYGSCRGSHLLG